MSTNPALYGYIHFVTELPVTSGWAMRYPDRQIVLIASQTVTKNTEILQLLEAR